MNWLLFKEGLFFLQQLGNLNTGLILDDMKEFLFISIKCNNDIVVMLEKDPYLDARWNMFTGKSLEYLGRPLRHSRRRRREGEKREGKQHMWGETEKLRLAPVKLGKEHVGIHNIPFP